MNSQTRSEVLRRWYGNQSMRRIARDLHLSRKTVSRIIAEHQQQRTKGTTDLPAPRQTRGSLVDPYEPALREYLARYPDISVVRLLEEIRRRGYQGSYTILGQRVKQLRPQFGRPPVERFETGPGVQGQMDYAVYTLDFTQEGRRKVNLFSYVLGYSRRQYLRFTASADMETTVREHVRAFEHLQGVAATLLPIFAHRNHAGIRPELVHRLATSILRRWAFIRYGEWPVVRKEERWPFAVRPVPTQRSSGLLQSIVGPPRVDCPA